MLLEVDGENGKKIIKLCETLVVPRIRVNLFSLQRVVDQSFIPVFGEVAGKAFIKKFVDEGRLEKVAAISINKGRLTLDCRQVFPIEGIQRGPQLRSECMKVELSLPLLHRRLGHSAEGALEKMIRGKMVRGIKGGVNRVSIGGFEPCKLGKITQHPHKTVPPENHR